MYFVPTHTSTKASPRAGSKQARKRSSGSQRTEVPASWAAIFEDMKRYVGFDERDASSVRALADVVRPALPRIVERFYAAIRRHHSALAVIDDSDQLARLKNSITLWLESLFCGSYGSDYCRKHGEIGRVHVHIGLPQHYVTAAMEIIWRELRGTIRSANVDGADAKLSALHKLLMIEVGLILETNRAYYGDRIRDVERSAMHEKLEQAEHLAHMGQLAASLAHEIKNPLAGISGAIQVIRGGMRPNDKHRPVLDEILRQVTRLDGTVKDLLIYARPQAPRLGRCDLTRVMDRVLTVLREEPDMRRVRVEYETEGAYASFPADESQIEQVLINLVLNAAQAVADEGIVRVLVNFEPREVQIIVADDGGGMDEATARRAFEAFYTRKARGTGLGLPICRKIVESHGGSIVIESVVGEGTRVIVRLPQA